MEDRKAQYFQYAVELLKAGTRPSADMLVHACGGSKQTALAVLNDFWQTYVPDILAGAGDFSPTIPFEVREAAKAMWTAATTTANAEAQAIYASLKVDIAIQAEIAEKAKAALSEAQAETASLQEEKAQAVSRAEAITQELLATEAAAAELRSGYEDAHARIATLQAELAQCRADQAAERAQASESIRLVTEALKEAHTRELATLHNENTLLQSRLETLRDEYDRAISLGQPALGSSPYRSRLRTVRRVKVKSAE